MSVGLLERGNPRAICQQDSLAKAPGRLYHSHLRPEKPNTVNRHLWSCGGSRNRIEGIRPEPFILTSAGWQMSLPEAVDHHRIRCFQRGQFRCVELLVGPTHCTIKSQIARSSTAVDDWGELLSSVRELRSSRPSIPSPAVSNNLRPARY